MSADHPGSTGLVAPRPAYPSGGHAYNAAVLRHWPAGWSRPDLVELPGDWPEPDASARAALAAALARFDTVVLDGLVGAAHPGLVGDAGAHGHRVILLVHMPLADHPGLPAPVRARRDAAERASVRAAWRVVATSRRAASELAARHGRPDVVAVPPGVDPAPPNEQHLPPHLLSVGGLAPHKNQLATARALAACADLAWTASLVGPPVDPAYAGAVAAALPSAARFDGPRTGAALEAAWASADLLLHPSRVESFGLVVTEALARGVPAIVGRGTGAEEALASGTPGRSALPGAAVDADDEDELARLLRGWLTDPTLRAAWRAAALAARPRLRPWAAAATELARLAADR